MRSLMIDLNPTVAEQFTAFANEVLEGDVLPDRERAAIILATAFALEDGSAVKNAIISAKQAGFTNEEIGYVSAMVLALRGQRLNRLGMVEISAVPIRS